MRVVSPIWSRKWPGSEYWRGPKLLENNTPLEVHRIGRRKIYVKREDLCCPRPGPTFSKFRGVVAHMRKQKPGTTIGVLDTVHSKAGWAVAYAGKELGYPVVNFWPRFKADPPSPTIPREQQRIASEMGATLVALRAGRSAILYHQARKFLKEHFRDRDTYLMPNALKLSESVSETAEEAARTEGLPKNGIMVVSISSGTIAAGVLAGLWSLTDDDWTVYLHMGYSRPEEACWCYVAGQAEIPVEYRDWVTFIDEHYSYSDSVDIPVPFPCNPYYDAKAWKWLTENVGDLPNGKPIVFWNIGD